MLHLVVSFPDEFCITLILVQYVVVFWEHSEKDDITRALGNDHLQLVIVKYSFEAFLIHHLNVGGMSIIVI